MLESDSFDSVQELVRFYVGQRRPVSQSSGVHIYCPVSRTVPLRYLEATFAISNSKQGSPYSPSSQRGAYIKRRSVTMTDGLTTEKMIPHRWARRKRSGVFVFLSDRNGVLFWNATIQQPIIKTWNFFLGDFIIIVIVSFLLYVIYMISDSDSPRPVETPVAPPEPEPEPVPNCRLCVCVWQ